MGAMSYSGTAASNTTVDGIGAAGSDSPDNIDNLVRALAASDANLVRDLGGNNTVGGSADAITVALADASTPTYFDGMIFAFRAASDSTTTTPTLNVDSLGAKTIKRSIQGVESALIAGDIQAGQTCQVVYRSAWASAAGAFELLNPSIASSIELGHATDTTLTRSAAGVAAVEGVQLQRVAYATAQASTSGTEIDFTGIPSWVKEIIVTFDQVSWNAIADLLVQIGDSGGIENTGYVSNSQTFIASPAIGNAATTAGFLGGFQDAGISGSGIMHIVNITGNVWVATAVYNTTSRGNISAGTKTLSATLDRLRVTSASAATFDNGQVNILYKG
jgi:hypothetical protein